MYNECRYVRVSGARCHSAALKGKAYCYFHLHNRRSVPVHTDAVDALTLSPMPESATLTLPLLEDRSSVQLAITQVLAALASNQIDNRRAGLLLYGLQIASQNAAHPDEIVDSKSVRSITHTSEGEEMAPVVTQKDFWDFEDDDDDEEEDDE